VLTNANTKSAAPAVSRATPFWLPGVVVAQLQADAPSIDAQSRTWREMADRDDARRRHRTPTGAVAGEWRWLRYIACMTREPLRDVGEWTRSVTVTAMDLANQAVDALRQAEALGIPVEDRARFTEYMSVLREGWALDEADKPIFVWPQEKRRLYYEAATQVRLLIKAAAVWSGLPQSRALKHKIKKALTGNALPVIRRDQQARDLMIEFSTAYMFALRNHAVEMPTDDAREDVRVRIAGFGQLVIECKRPQFARSIYDKLREGCDKLEGLCDGDDCIGMVVIGIDRVLDDCVIPAVTDYEREIPSVSDDATLQSWFETMMQGRIVEAVQGELRSHRTFFPKIPFVGLHIAVPVLTKHQGMRMLEQIAVYNAGGQAGWQRFAPIKTALFDELAEEPTGPFATR
jgi:hypothetical protein